MEIEYLSCEENTGLAFADNEAVSSGGKDDASSGAKKKVLGICLVLEERSGFIAKELVIEEGESKQSLISMSIQRECQIGHHKNIKMLTMAHHNHFLYFYLPWY